MAEIFIKIKSVEEIIGSEITLANKINEVKSQTAKIRRNMRGKVASMNQIGSKLEQLARIMESENAAMRNFSSALGQAKDKYVETETMLANLDRKGQAATEPGSGGSNGDGSAVADGERLSFMDSPPDVLAKLLGEFGCLGGIGQFIIEGYQEKPEWDDSAKLFFKVLDNAVSGVGEDGALNWSRILTGISKGEKKSFFDALLEEVDDFKFEKIGNSGNNAKGAASNLKAVAKWGTAILDVVNNFGENTKEHGGTKTPRFWQEWITESAIDIGSGILISAAIGAVVAPGAVGVAVGAIATVGIGMGLNAIAKGVSGDSNATFTEWASDAIWDKVVPKAAEIGKNAKEAVSATSKVVMNTFKDAGGWLAGQVGKMVSPVTKSMPLVGWAFG